MSDSKMPEHKLRQHGDAGANAQRGGERIGGAGPSGAPTCRAGDDTGAATPASSSPVLRALRLGSRSPLSWWRMLPADGFRSAVYLKVSSALDEIATELEGASFGPALYGDPDAAITFVLSLMPVGKVGLKVDIAMTSVLRCALEGDLRAALALAHVVDRAGLDPALAADLCASWFEFYLRYSPTRGGLTPAEKAVMKALRAFDAVPSHNGGRP